MKNNRHAFLRSTFAVFATAFVCFFSQAQLVTGTISTEVYHNTSSTANSTVTYNINLSNGWKAGVSSINALEVKNASSTVVYTHASATTPYGTVSPSLAPGYYIIEARVTTKNNSGNWVAVNMSQELWVGYKALWTKSLDMAEGINQYALKRNNMTSGLTRSFAQSFNKLAANTAGWIEMSAPSVTTSGSSVFLVLEPLSSPGTFSPSDNISYVEFYYTNSTTKGIRVKARNASNVYAITNLTGPVLGDKIRFVRTAAGDAVLQLNASQTAIYTFAKKLTSELYVYVLATLDTDQATGIASSFGYPSADLPLSNTFANDKGTGDLTVRFNTTGATGPYHYFVSPDPIPDLKKVYKELKDSIYGGTLDSTAFFTGPVATDNYTLREVPTGNYYVSTFDSKGNRIYSTTHSVLPAMTYSDMSNVKVVYDEYLSQSPDSYVSPNVFMTEQTEGRIVFNLYEITADHAFGLVYPTDAVGSGSNTYSKIAAGFCVKNGLLYTVDKGVLSSTTVPAKKNLPIEIIQGDGEIKLFSNGSLLTTISVASTFEFKLGACFKEWGIKLRIRPFHLVMLPFRVAHAVSANSCSNNALSLTMTYPAVSSLDYFGNTITAHSLQLYTTFPTSTAVGSLNQTSFTNLAPGVYVITGTVSIGSSPATLYPVTQYVYAGYATSWESEENIFTQDTYPVTWRTHAVGGSSVNSSLDITGRAIATGKLAPNTAGWVSFTPRSVANTSFDGPNIFALSEAPQLGTLQVPVFNMPYLYFPTAGGMCMINNPTTQTVQVVPYTPGIPMVARRDDAGAFRLTQNNVQIGNTISSYYFGRWKPSVLSKRKATGFSGIVSNFNCSVPEGQYAQLKYDLDGYYHIMKNGEIRFVFNQEYASADLTFNIYNWRDQLVGTQTDFPAVPTTFGMNYLTINVKDPDCIGKGMFYMEVINSKKEVLYLRFYNDYSGCLAPPIDDEEPSDN